MKKGYDNKMIKSDTTTGIDTGVENLTVFFFPAHSISIHAKSKAEALEKLDEHIKSLQDKK